MFMIDSLVFNDYFVLNLSYFINVEFDFYDMK